MAERKDFIDKLVDLFHNQSRENLEIAMNKLTYVELYNLFFLVKNSLTTASGAMREDTK